MMCVHKVGFRKYIIEIKDATEIDGKYIIEKLTATFPRHKFVIIGT